ncbi:MAG: TIGR02281 family clan AA aspartic protease [Candidatus Competibacterales bacterium]|nr:TIGR02281 family clan AA aspartic protease [Candidatus Competibacterales bacterium]
MSDALQRQRRMARVMVYAAWILLLGLLTLLFQGWLDRSANPNRDLTTYDPSEPPEVVLERNRGGHYVAPGFINGNPVRFLVDTGATDVNIPAPVAERLELERGAPQQAMTANGVITVYRTRLERVRLGNIVRHDVSASINPRMDGSTVLLGMSFMRDLELIQRNDTLTLRHPATGSR